MTAQASIYSTIYSTYNPVGKALFSPAGKIGPNRHFDHAGGIWRELPRKRLRLRRWMLLATVATGYWMMWGHLMPVAVALAPATSRDVPVYIEASAAVQANQTVTVHALIDGQLSEVVFREGQDVKAGDVLARIDPHTYQTQYDEAVANKMQDEAMLAKSRNDLSKLKLPAHGKRADAAPIERSIEEKRSQIRQFEVTVQSDQVVIDTLKMQLDRSVITAPIDGRAGIRQVDVGNMVHSSDAGGLVVITQIEPIAVVFDLPEKTLRPVSDRLAKGEKVSVLAMDSDGQHVLDEGTVALMDNQVDAASGAIHLKANFPNHNRLLWPGASVHIRLLVSTLKGAVTVPAAAIHTPAPAVGGEKSGAPFVYVYQPASNKVEMRDVKVSIAQDGYTVITEGLHAGDKVVTASAAPIEDGNPVILR